MLFKIYTEHVLLNVTVIHFLKCHLFVYYLTLLDSIP